MDSLNDEQVLVAMIEKSFFSVAFDSAAILCKAMEEPEFARAIDRLLPPYRQRRKYRRLVHKLLIRLAEEHFKTDVFSWWHTKMKHHEHAYEADISGGR